MNWCYLKMENFGLGWTKFIFLGILILTCWISESRASLDMADYCGKELSMTLKSGYQVELELSDKHIYDGGRIRGCEMTIQSWNTPFEKLMFYFEDLDLECEEGHLEFFVGQNSKTRVNGLERNVCGDSKPKGIFNADVGYLRIRYIPKKSQSIGDIFSIVITAYSDDRCPSFSHKCHNSRCIDKDTACNDNDSCGDGSGCDDGIKGSTSVFPIIGVIVGVVAVLALISGVVICCICCNRKTGKTQGKVQYERSPVSTVVTLPASSQHQGYSQPVYGISQGGHCSTIKAPNPIASTSILPTAPIPPNYQATYHEPVPVFYYGQQPDAPPQYSELLSRSDRPTSSNSNINTEKLELDNASKRTRF